MEEVLLKMNMIKNHNYIIRLEKEKKQRQAKIQTYITEYRKQNQKIIDRQQEQIRQLQMQNEKLQKMVNRIPNWILKFFVK